MTKPISPADVRAALTHIAPLIPEAPSKAAFAHYMTAVTAFGVIESTYVPVGQTDTRLRDELRAALSAAPVRPAAEILRGAIERHAEDVLAADPDALPWAYLDALDPVDAAAPETTALHERWLRAMVYSALVAYGRHGAALPPSPAGLMIDVALVPGDKPRTRFVDEDDDEGAGVPVTIYARP